MWAGHSGNRPQRVGDLSPQRASASLRLGRRPGFDPFGVVSHTKTDAQPDDPKEGERDQRDNQKVDKYPDRAQHEPNVSAMNLERGIDTPTDRARDPPL